jgi:hypothetical protein
MSPREAALIGPADCPKLKPRHRRGHLGNDAGRSAWPVKAAKSNWVTAIDLLASFQLTHAFDVRAQNRQSHYSFHRDHCAYRAYA